jgi:preprotein translocase subunit SecG
MLFNVLLVLNMIVCVALVGVILLQRSEGGALGMGGGPSGFMTARGAGTLLTRATAVLAAVFFALSLVLTLVAGGRTSSSVVDRLEIEGIDPSAMGRPAAAPTAPATTGLPSAPLPDAAVPGPTETVPAGPATTAPLEAPRPDAAAPATTSPAQ